jgi:hypothetical protein
MSFVFVANPFHAQGYVLMEMTIDQCNAIVYSCPLFTFVVGNTLVLYNVNNFNYIPILIAIRSSQMLWKSVSNKTYV